MSELIEKQKVLDALREIATEKFSLDDPYGVYINVLIDVEEKICRLPVVQPNGPDNLVKDSQGLAKDLVNDCISRKAALDALEKSKEIYFDRQVIIGAMKDIVRNLPSAQPKSYREGYQAGVKDAQSEQRWIPCSERLPEAEDCPMDCLVTRKSKYIGNYTDMAVCEKNGMWTHEDWDAIVLGDVKDGKSTGLISTRDDDIIAWMPLPEPYKAESEDKK